MEWCLLLCIHERFYLTIQNGQAYLIICWSRTCKCVIKRIVNQQYFANNKYYWNVLVFQLCPFLFFNFLSYSKFCFEVLLFEPWLQCSTICVLSCMHFAEIEFEVIWPRQKCIMCCFFPPFLILQFTGERSALHFSRWFWSGKLWMLLLVLSSLRISHSL